MGNDLARLALAVTLMTALATVTAAARTALPDEQLWRVALPNRVQIDVLVGRPSEKQPKAAIILMPGGDGRLKFNNFAQPSRLKNNFLVRSRDALRRAGYVTALLDAPSDRLKQPGLLAGYRASKTHVTRDIAPIVLRLRATFDAPVFIIGISRGAVSAANAARRLGAELAGAALLSALTLPNRKGATINNVMLDKITIPTLFIHHVSDRCPVTPLHGARASFETMQGTKAAVRWATVTGGTDGSPACKGKSHHGFWRAEGQALGHVKFWLNLTLKK